MTIIRKAGEATMFKLIFGNFLDPVEPTVQAVTEHFQQSQSLTLYGFASLEEAVAFAQKFPKYTKVSAHSCKGSSSFEDYGVSSVYEDGTHYAYGVGIRVSPINAVTGEFNEQGQKRINKYIEVMVKEGFIE